MRFRRSSFFLRLIVEVNHRNRGKGSSVRDCGSTCHSSCAKIVRHWAVLLRVSFSSLSGICSERLSTARAQDRSIVAMPHAYVSRFSEIPPSWSSSSHLFQSGKVVPVQRTTDNFCLRRRDGPRTGGRTSRRLGSVPSGAFGSLVVLI